VENTEYWTPVPTLYNTKTLTDRPTDQVQPKPFGLGQCPMGEKVGKSGKKWPVAGNQRTQSAGQVLAINCSKSRRVFVSFVSCLRLCGPPFERFALTDMRQDIELVRGSPTPPKIDSSQCKLLSAGSRVTSSVGLPSGQGMTAKSSQWHNLYRSLSFHPHS